MMTLSLFEFTQSFSKIRWNLYYAKYLKSPLLLQSSLPSTRPAMHSRKNTTRISAGSNEPADICLQLFYVHANPSKAMLMERILQRSIYVVIHHRPFAIYKIISALLGITKPRSSDSPWESTPQRTAYEETRGDPVFSSAGFLRPRSAGFLDRRGYLNRDGGCKYLL